MKKQETTIHLPITSEGRKVKIIPTQPVIFLAGPIRNAPDWHSDAIKMLLQKNTDAFVASPRRTVAEDLRYSVESDNPTYEVFERQRAWEQYYLYSAAQRGCILFYLPKESELKDDENKVYAHITMMELGEWIARYKQNPNINLIIATDGQFPEWSTIEYELKSEEVNSVYYSLEGGVKAAIKLIEQYGH